MTEKPTITEYLASLGSTPDKIAASLRAQGLKGKPGSKTQCVMANAINTQCRGWGGIHIYGDYCKRDKEGRCHYSATYRDLQITDPRLPQPVQDFMGLFDGGKYPELVATVVRTGTYIRWE